jgi:hypothetical protein
MTAAPPFRKFEQRAPAHQNAVDIFEGKWACDLVEVCPVVKRGVDAVIHRRSPT